MKKTTRHGKRIYLAVKTHANGDQEVKQVKANSTAQAWERAFVVYNANEKHHDGIQVYHAVNDTQTLLLLAVSVASSKAKKTALRKTDNDTYWQAWQALSALHIKLEQFDTLTKEVDKKTESLLFDTYYTKQMSTLSAVAQDLLGEANASIYASIRQGDSVTDAYAKALIAMDMWVNAESKANQCDSLERLTDDEGQVYLINNAIGKILHNKKTYVPHTLNGMSDADKSLQKRLGKALNGTAQTLTDTQLDVFELLGQGYSDKLISQKNGATLSAVSKMKVTIQSKFVAWCDANDNDLLAVHFAVKLVETLSNKHITTDKVKAQNALRAKRYRERKKAKSEK